MGHQNKRAVPAGTGNGSGIDPRDSKISFQDSPQTDGTQVIVTTNGRSVGFVRARSAGQFEAVTANYESLGRYTSDFAAARAVLQHIVRAGCP